jgi:hypothetical protein
MPLDMANALISPGKTVRSGGRRYEARNLRPISTTFFAGSPKSPINAKSKSSSIDEGAFFPSALVLNESETLLVSDIWLSMSIVALHRVSRTVSNSAHAINFRAASNVFASSSTVWFTLLHQLALTLMPSGCQYQADNRIQSHSRSAR